MIVPLCERDKKGYYRLLRVSPDASDEELARAFKRLRQKLHPDKCGHARSKEIFQYLHTIYELLIDHEQRAEYDPYWNICIKEWSELTLTYTQQQPNADPFKAR